MLWWNELILLIVPIKLKHMQTRVQTRKNASFPSRILHSIWSRHGASKPSRLPLWAYLGCSFPRLDAHRSQAGSQLWHVHFSVLVGVQFGEQLLVSFGAILGRGAPAVREKQLSYKLKHSCTETEETACRAPHAHTERAKKLHAGTSGWKLRVRMSPAGRKAGQFQSTVQF